MTELAYDANGHPIRLTADVAKFLVRQHRPKAPPRVLFRNGRRLTLPVAAGIEDLRALTNNAPGRYRLLPLDAADEPVEGVPEAYVELDPEPAQPYGTASAAPSGMDAARMALTQDPRELLLLETMRANTELARALIDRLPDIMKSSAYLIQAADGAGLPRRPPLWLNHDDDDDDDQDDDDDDYFTPPPREPSVLETIASAALGGGNLAGLAKLLSGGAGATAPAAPSPAPAPPTPSPTHAPAPTPTAQSSAAPRNAAPPTDPQAHLVAILSQLTAEEQAYAERVISQLGPAAIKEWHDSLLAMTVDEAVALIRAKAQGQET